MKIVGVLFAAVVALSAQIPANPSAPIRHLEYNFAYNARLESGGHGTGTMSVDILGTAADGGMLVKASNLWYEAVRPTEETQCEVYPNGSLSCNERPYSLSPEQLVLFPLLARDYFQGLAADGTSAWLRNYDVNRGDLWKWTSVFSMRAQGQVEGRYISIAAEGTSLQLGAYHRKAHATSYILYDPLRKLPVAVSDVRMHVPNQTVFTSDSVQLKLTKDSLTSD
jgi:hypothetical protein